MEVCEHFEEACAAPYPKNQMRIPLAGQRSYRTLDGVLNPLLVIKSDIPCIVIYEVRPMGEHHKECRECGWRGSAAELDETSDAPTGKTQNFCPDCGGKDFEDLHPDEKEQVPES